MKFHGLLIGVTGLDRPKQRFSHSREDVEAWAVLVLKDHPMGQVQIFENKDVLIDTLPHPDVFRKVAVIGTRARFEQWCEVQELPPVEVKPGVVRIGREEFINVETLDQAKCIEWEMGIPLRGADALLLEAVRLNLRKEKQK